MKVLRWVHDNLIHVIAISVFVVVYGVIALGVAQTLFSDISALLAH